eukprot:6179358-Pleurochrysis_carterae.AAC.3
MHAYPLRNARALAHSRKLTHACAQRARPLQRSCDSTLSKWVAKDLVNLGNALCDQEQHAEAIPLYLRALAIDQACWLLYKH